MLFMNDFDINRAARVLRDDPAGSEAVRQVALLRDWANANSDGWCYWPKPVNAAKGVIQLINAAVDAFYAGSTPKVDPAALRKALRPVRAFRTRQGADFQIVSV